MRPESVRIGVLLIQKGDDRRATRCAQQDVLPGARPSDRAMAVTALTAPSSIVRAERHTGRVMCMMQLMIHAPYRMRSTVPPDRFVF
jgi:hypothetical protein